MQSDQRISMSREGARASREGNRPTASREGTRTLNKSVGKVKKAGEMLSPMDAASRETTMSTRPSRKSDTKRPNKLALSRGSTELSSTQQTTRGTRRKGSIAIKTLESELKKTMPRGWNIREGFQALAHFKKIVKFVIVFMKWIKALREEAEKTGGGGSEAITGLASQDFASAMMANDGTTFDIKNFQSRKEILLSADVREILNQHPTLRTKEQIQLAKYGLQHVQSFSEYPLHMQEKLATVAYFQEVDNKRVIIREGHTAENFYFILSGSAIVTKLVKDDDVGKVELRFERHLSKGDSFGEMELLHHSSRQCTVVSQTPMTLLCVGRDNFFRIFMSSQGENSLPEHIKFLCSLEMLKGFPPQAFLDNKEKCLLHFFRRGAVVVKDSLESEWIYFIKSGTCQVLKELKGLQHSTKKKNMKKRLPLPPPPTDFSLSLPRLGIGAQPSKTNSGLKALSPPKPKTPREKLLTMKSETPTLPANNFLEGDFLSKQDDHLPLLMMEKRLETDKDFKAEYLQMVSSLDIPMENTTPHRTATRNTKLNMGYTKSKYNTLTVVKNKKRHLAPISPPPYAAETGRKTRVKFIEDVEEKSIKEDKSVNGNQSMISGAQESVLSKSHARKEADPVYVQVDLLKPRDVFGLTNIKFDEFMENKSLNVSLVSRGAECVMVEKQFFIDNAPQEVKHAVMSLVRPYPEVEVLQGNLEIKAGWDDYREIVLQLSQDKASERKSLLRSTFSM